MNITETAGGSSSKAQENGDASNESERPLKKARFAWQVKGKYHLKNDANNTAKTSSPTSSDHDAAESSGSGSSNNRGTEQNLDILGDYLMKQDFNTLDSVISPSDQTLLTPSTSISNEKVPYPRYVSSFEQNSNNVLKRSSESSNDKLHSVSRTLIQSFTEDQCIARWQTKQMVKGFVDNTINRVLDVWIHAPLRPEDEHPRFVALEVADFINNLPGDNSVENEGILMAISAHGLQQPASSNSSDTNDDNYLNSSPNNTDDFRPLTPLPSDEESREPVNSNNLCDTDTSSNDLDMAWSYSDEQKNECDDVSPFPLIPDATSLSYQDVNTSHQNSGVGCDDIDNTGDNHCDFLDEAILFAIQSKGLTTFGSDYG